MAPTYGTDTPSLLTPHQGTHPEDLCARREDALRGAGCRCHSRGVPDWIPCTLRAHCELDEDCAMAQHLRLTVLDEVFIAADDDLVPSVQIEARVSGRFEPDRLAAALRTAVAKHPLARARLGSASLTARSLYWEVADRADHLAVE